MLLPAICIALSLLSITLRLLSYRFKSRTLFWISVFIIGNTLALSVMAMAFADTKIAGEIAGLSGFFNFIFLFLSALDEPDNPL